MVALFTPDSPGYEAVRRPVNTNYHDVRPRQVVLCRSVSDVVTAIRQASGDRVAIRGGGHCFSGRSSTDGTVLDMSGLDGISVSGDGVATIGAGARLAGVYAALHSLGRTVPAGCGPTVGIAGLTLGGGIGLLGRKYGLTCDRLVGARIVLADGSVVDCDDSREPDLFWALRGAGGGQFGVVTDLRFDTIAEPLVTRIDGRWTSDVAELVALWQGWAPDAPDGITVNLSIAAGNPVRTTLFGASMLGPESTRELLREFVYCDFELRGGLPYSQLKSSFADPLDRFPRIRSEFFAHSMSDATVTALLRSGRGQLSFTAMGGAYNRIAPDATAFAHRSERFLLEHVGEFGDGWVDESWAIAHSDASGHVYPNFPDPALDDWDSAYHGDNYTRLQQVKRMYDPDQFFDFRQAIQPTVKVIR